MIPPLFRHSTRERNRYGMERAPINSCLEIESVLLSSNPLARGLLKADFQGQSSRKRLQTRPLERLF